MSMNLHVRSRYASFDLAQTRTDETYAILAKKDRYRAYAAYLRTRDVDDPRRYDDHLRKLRKFLKDNPNAEFFAA